MAAPQRPRPKAIVCDVNGTLVSLDPIGQRMKELGLTENDLELWFAKVLRDGIAAAAADGFATFSAFGGYHLKLMLCALGDKAPVDMEQAVDHVLEGFNQIAPHGDLQPAFQRLTEAGIKVTSMTNGNAKFTNGFLQRNGLDKYVSLVLDVSAPRLWKPRKEAYVYVTDQLHLKPEEVMLVAIHPWDCNGAKNAGLQAAYVNRNNQPYPEFFATPDLSVQSFVELAEKLTSSS
ncbi:hypothetical protein WJX72_002544 [[Myrmecia] bisecta]|uniref:Haloacid dehalogenase n=1 Tax=[Myrmecia] bisecta TaxID=41462 RepID=A0AAW1QPN6_9CHLO